MAQPTDGNSTDDEEEPQPILVTLNKNDASPPDFYVHLKDVGELAGIPMGDYVDVQLDVEGETPALVLLHIGSEKPDDDLGRYRKIASSGRTYVPKEFLESPEGTASGLSLDINREEYSSDNRLVFEALVDEGLILLIPRAWEDGDIYPGAGQPVPDELREDTEADGEPKQATLPGTASDDESDPTVDTIDEGVIERVSQTTGVAKGELTAALSNIERHVSTVDLSGELVDEHDPLVVEDRTVLVVDRGVWDRDLAADNLDVDADVLDAARLVHEQQADDLIREARARDYRHVTREHSAVVTGDQSDK